MTLRSVIRIAGAAALFVLTLAACSPIRGYPADPEDTTATLDALKPYFGVDQDKQYNSLAIGSPVRLALRNEIVLGRMRAYDLEFDDFERRLNSDATGITAGGDLVLLILGGLGATTGASATKAALAAASAGIVGAQAAIDKDLYYQKTLPALLAQMEANRAKVKLAILTGLNLDDTKYSLPRAELDLDGLKRAGGIPASIQDITQKAVSDAAESQSKIEGLRALSFNQLPSTHRLLTWLVPKGQTTVVAANNDKLQAWLKAQPAPLPDLTPLQFVAGSNADLEAARKKAIIDLQVP